MKTASVVVIGSGLIGADLAERMAGVCAVRLVSARALLTMTAEEITQIVRSATLLVFAQGANVNTRSFDRDYDQLLASRTDPLMRVASVAIMPLTRYVLISSTVACLKDHGARSLAALQSAYEQEFKRIFAGRPTLLMRFGTVCMTNGGVVQSLRSLNKTFLLKRLRISRDTDIPYVGQAAMQHVAALLCDQHAFDGRTIAVVEERGLDLNSLLDQHLPVDWRIFLPITVYSWIFERFGIRPEFFSVTQAMTKPGCSNGVVAGAPGC